MPLVRKNFVVLILVIAVILILIGFALDNRLKISRYDIHDNRIPPSFDGCVIAQLSDLHCRVFGKNQAELITAVASGKPNYIMLTGDIIDASILNYQSVSDLFSGLKKIAPVFAVSGNHENNNEIIRRNMDQLYEEYNIHLLNNESVALQKDGEVINLYGADDKAIRPNKFVQIPHAVDGTYNILLYHRANEFDTDSNLGYRLVLSGHMHGGLIRLLFVGGILTPDGDVDFNQKYTGGMFKENGTILISNRGMAPSHGIPRIFNRPEVVFVTLHSS